MTGMPRAGARAVTTVLLGLGLASSAALAGAPSGLAVGAEPTAGADEFVQEGTPAPVGGRVVPWYDANLAQADASRPWELTDDGATHVAVASQSGHVLVLRSDGRVIAFEADPYASSPFAVPDLPQGVAYTGVSVINSGPSALFLRSDGQIVATAKDSSASYRPTVPALPDGTTYVAVDGGANGYAVRSDGRIVAIPVPVAGAPSCEGAFVPPAGVSYTAINADGSTWAAVRSDGAIVTCLDDDASFQVLLPPAGRRYVGTDVTDIDTNVTAVPHGDFGYAALDDGTIVGFGAAPQPATVPAGRTVQSLTALQTSTGSSTYAYSGAAVLDDGSLLSWGEEVPSPPEPLGATGYVGAASSWIYAWVITTAPQEPVTISADVPDTVYIGHAETATVDVVGPDGPVRSGRVYLDYRYDDGTYSYATSGTPVEDGRATFTLSYGYYGERHLVFRYEWPGYVTTSAPAVVTTPIPTTPVITVDPLPEPWHRGSQYVPLPIQVGTPDGTPLIHGSTVVVDLTTGQRIDHGGSVADMRALEEGEHRIQVQYHEGAWPWETITWEHVFSVLPPAETTLQATTSPWVYFANSVQVDATVTTADGSPLGAGHFDAEVGGVVTSSGHIDTQEPGATMEFDASTGETLPGGHDVVVRWVPYDVFAGAPTLPSQITRPLTVAGVPTTTSVRFAGWSPYGTDTPVTVTVAGGSLGGGPGEVLLTIDGTEVGRVAAPEHSSTFELVVDGSAVAPGRHTLVARYTGTLISAPSQQSLPIVVPPGSLSASAPTIVGEAQVGGGLAVRTGTWNDGTTFTYQWLADGEPIQGATAPGYRPTAQDLGASISVAVTGSLTHYLDRTMTSEGTTPVGDGPVRPRLRDDLPDVDRGLLWEQTADLREDAR